MYINFKEINPTLLDTFIQKFNLNPKDITILYKLTNTHTE